MKKNLVPLLGIAFVVAIISTGIFYGLFVNKLSSAGSAGPAIVVAARNLDRGASLQAADLKLTPWGSAAVPKGAFTEIAKVSGSTLTTSLQENEPLLAGRVAAPGSRDAGGLGIAQGMRAVSIHATDSTGVVSVLRPGHKVDVQLISTHGSLPELKTILQNVEVLSVNLQGDGRTPQPVVTLLLTPEGAGLAGLGDSAARLRLALRNPLDEGTAPADRVTLPGIMGTPARR
jgi:pilus assembly protein CpaB